MLLVLDLSDSMIWTSDQVTKTIKEMWLEEKVHNFFVCRLSGCSSLSREEQGRLRVAEDAKKLEKKKPDKFKHELLLNPRYWSVCYVESYGFFCVLCKKHNMKNAQNKSQTFIETPSKRIKEDSLKIHMASAAHSSAVEADLLQRMSAFHHDLVEKNEVQTTVLQNVFSSCNSEAITELVKKALSASDLDISKLMGLSTDGASVMVGKTNGVSAKLRQSNDKLLNMYCLPPLSTGLYRQLSGAEVYQGSGRCSKTAVVLLP